MERRSQLWPPLEERLEEHPMKIIVLLSALFYKGLKCIVLNGVLGVPL